MDFKINTQQLEEEANQGWESQIDDLLDDDETGPPVRATSSLQTVSSTSDSSETASSGRETARKRSPRKRLKRDITAEDLKVLEFLAKFKYANARQLGIATSKDETLVRQRLRALKSVGLVNSDAITGRRNVWFITARGAEVLDMEQRVAADEVSIPRLGDLSYSGVGHMLAVSQVAAQLMTAMPYTLGRSIALPKVKLQDVLTDYEMDRAWKTYREQFQQVNTRPDAGSKAEKVWKQRLVTEAPKGLGMLVNKSFRHDQYGTGRLTHRPDLVVTMPNGKKLAIEVELTTKKASEYEDIMRRYEENSEGFAAVAWITNSPLVKQRLEGFKGENLKMLVVDLLAADGEPFTESAWKL